MTFENNRSHNVDYKNDIYWQDYMNKEDPAELDIRNNKIKEGFLIKRSRILKEWKKRWMVLTKTHLYSFENKGVYRSPTEKIPLREVSTIKSFYKNQYDRPQVFRIESDDTYFYLSSNDHQQKWAWMTAIEKMTQMIRNPAALDPQNLIRQSIRMSNALRQSSLARKSTVSLKSIFQPPQLMLKNIKLKLKSQALDYHFSLKNTQKIQSEVSKIEQIKVLSQTNTKVEQAYSSKSLPQKQPKIIEKIIEKIVEVKVPVTIQKIVEKIVYIEKEGPNNNAPIKNKDGLSDLFAALLGSKLDDPIPLLDFVAFLGLTGVETFQTIAMNFCCEQDSHRFFAELLLQALNEQTSEERLNRYCGFIYILCQREPDYFYASDLKILVQILMRQLQLYRSDLNQMITLQVLKTILTYHLNLMTHKKDDIKALAAEIANLGPSHNREIATQICLLIQ